MKKSLFFLMTAVCMLLIGSCAKTDSPKDVAMNFSKAILAADMKTITESCYYESPEETQQFAIEVEKTYAQEGAMAEIMESNVVLEFVNETIDGDIATVNVKFSSEGKESIVIPFELINVDGAWKIRKISGKKLFSPKQ